eukprot:CAMPEP_0185778622 /NCGR_PEP_ID=MMETSP1174-20130828/93049_1 /TAXON_ID=35687 /ORGANISM="Dictyocha speculum, Strain CCMP1381" /LENGTH=201 /DNA_ID=CAMNT_0028467411 /DNA_START=100 /DNA_END=705 /DNA_ORIENTATION=+
MQTGGKCGSTLSTQAPSVSRRNLLDAFTAASSFVAFQPLSSSADIATPIVKGVITLQAGVDPPPTGSALYITVRPDRPDNVPQAILSGTRGKPPPIAAARFDGPREYPFQFELQAPVDLTPEGAATANENDDTITSFWWSGSNFVVSARLDSDGVAATRDPTDLVGRGVFKADSSILTTKREVLIELQGRGVGGKFVTKKS